MQSPTPEEIKQYRTASGLTQTQAAELIYCSLGAFQKWEQGDRAMHPAFFELFKIKKARRSLIDWMGYTL